MTPLRGLILIDRAGFRRLVFAAAGGSDLVSVGAIGSEDAVEADEIHPGYGYQGGESGDEVEGFQYDVRSSVPVTCLRLVSNIAAKQAANNAKEQFANSPPVAF